MSKKTLVIGLVCHLAVPVSLLGVLLWGIFAPVQAAPPAYPEPATCAEWGKAGGWVLTKCIDDDGVACISSTSGMLSCKWD